MTQVFYDVPIDGDMFFCEETYCDVYIYMFGSRMECPGCDAIGKVISNENYPITIQYGK